MRARVRRGIDSRLELTLEVDATRQLYIADPDRWPVTQCADSQPHEFAAADPARRLNGDAVAHGHHEAGQQCGIAVHRQVAVIDGPPEAVPQT